MNCRTEARTRNIAPLVKPPLPCGPVCRWIGVLGLLVGLFVWSARRWDAWLVGWWVGRLVCWLVAWLVGLFGVRAFVNHFAKDAEQRTVSAPASFGRLAASALVRCRLSRGRRCG